MTYRLDLTASMAASVREVARSELSKAERDLTGEELDRAEAVHEARKRFKKLRGLLRLARPALGTSYTIENKIFRDCGRRLADTRDADAMVECIEALRERYDDDLDGQGKALQRAIEDWRNDVLPAEDDLERHVAEVVATLDKAEDRLRSWSLPPDDRHPLLDGLEKTYRRGRKAMGKAYDDPSGERFHDWRKRVKYHWYHLRLLRDVWPDPIKARIGETKTLSDLLGDDHDLTVLRDLVNEGQIGFSKPGLQATLLGLIERRQAELRGEARPLGARLFAEKPKHLAKRIERYWAACDV